MLRSCGETEDGVIAPLQDFLWPPVMTVKGCRCLLPFQFEVEQLKHRLITYERCTDIEEPGHGWCAVDPDAGRDPNCGINSTDPRANMGATGYGWTHYDYCLHQPKPARLRTWKRRVVTEMGCTCDLPFKYQGKEGGYKLHTCTQLAGQGEGWVNAVKPATGLVWQVGRDWCAVKVSPLPEPPNPASAPSDPWGPPLPGHASAWVSRSTPLAVLGASREAPPCCLESSTPLAVSSQAPPCCRCLERAPPLLSTPTVGSAR